MKLFGSSDVKYSAVWINLLAVCGCVSVCSCVCMKVHIYVCACGMSSIPPPQYATMKALMHSEYLCLSNLGDRLLKFSKVNNKIRNAWQTFYLTDSRTFSQNLILAGKLNFWDSCLFFYFLEERLYETSFHIGLKIGMVFSLIEKNLDCKSPKIPNKSPLSKTRTIKHEKKKKRKKETERRPWWDKGEGLRRHFMRAFRRSYHLWKTQENFSLTLSILRYVYLWV